jgi:hypothetical protein
LLQQRLATSRQEQQREEQHAQVEEQLHQRSIAGTEAAAADLDLPRLCIQPLQPCSWRKLFQAPRLSLLQQNRSSNGCASSSKLWGLMLLQAASVLRRWQKAFSWQGWGLWLALRPPPPPPPPKSQS